MNINDSFLFQEPDAANLEKMRDQRRIVAGKLTYDCYNAIYAVTDDKVVCRLGHKFYNSADGSVSLRSILRGMTYRQCSNCNDFNGDDLGCRK